MSRTRALLAALLVATACLLAAAPALGLVDLADVAASDVAAEASAPLAAEGRDRLEAAAAELRAAGTPTKFVVLAARPGEPLEYARSLRSRLSFRGEVFVLSAEPRSLAIASPLPSSTVQAHYDARLPELRQDPVAGMIALARDLAAQRGTVGPSSGGGVPAAPAAGRDGGGGGGGGGLLLVILLVGAAFVLLSLLIRRARSRAARVAPPDPVAGARALEPLVDALAAQISDLDDDVDMAGDRTAAIREHYDVAVLSYGEARGILETREPTMAQVEEAGAALERGLRAARRTRAVLEGRPPAEADQEPLLEGMCAFDPKHGRATDTVEIQTPGGDRAELPACANCAAGMARGEEPRFREVEQDGRYVPYWQGRGMGTGMGGGMLGGGLGPVLGGALAGVILGGMLGGGDAEGAEGGFGGGGDVGGDGGGGGDFGGGGGGDF